MRTTPNYNLTQFEANDLTGWVSNYNPDMLKIDTAIKANADSITGQTSQIEAAKTTADTALSNAQTAYETATQAKGSAESAINAANVANSNATLALNTANTAQASATSAGTTANNALEVANSKLNNIELIWENPNPNQSINNFTINLTKPYKILIIEYLAYPENVASEKTYFTDLIVRKLNDEKYYRSDGFSAKKREVMRRLKITDTEITILNGAFHFIDNTNYDEDNTSCIPNLIWGIA